MELERKLESVTTTTVDNDVNYCYTIQKIELSDESIAKLANALVKHGHWEKLYTNNYKCSVCGSWWTDDGDTYLIEFNYCPNCGAKMDEVEKKEIKKICILSNGTLKEEYDIPNVIRCKDCKYWAYDNFNEEGEISDSWCSRPYTGYMSVSADDFCSRGERKDEED